MPANAGWLLLTSLLAVAATCEQVSCHEDDSNHERNWRWRLPQFPGKISSFTLRDMWRKADQKNEKTDGYSLHLGGKESPLMAAHPSTIYSVSEASAEMRRIANKMNQLRVSIDQHVSELPMQLHPCVKPQMFQQQTIEPLTEKVLSRSLQHGLKTHAYAISGLQERSSLERLFGEAEHRARAELADLVASLDPNRVEGDDPLDGNVKQDLQFQAAQQDLHRYESSVPPGWIAKQLSDCIESSAADMQRFSADSQRSLCRLLVWTEACAVNSIGYVESELRVLSAAVDAAVDEDLEFTTTALDAVSKVMSLLGPTTSLKEATSRAESALLEVLIPAISSLETREIELRSSHQALLRVIELKRAELSEVASEASIATHADTVIELDSSTLETPLVSGIRQQHSRLQPPNFSRSLLRASLEHHRRALKGMRCLRDSISNFTSGQATLGRAQPRASQLEHVSNKLLLKAHEGSKLRKACSPLIKGVFYLAETMADVMTALKAQGGIFDASQLATKSSVELADYADLFEAISHGNRGVKDAAEALVRSAGKLDTATRELALSGSAAEAASAACILKRRVFESAAVHASFVSATATDPTPTDMMKRMQVRMAFNKLQTDDSEATRNESNSEIVKEEAELFPQNHSTRAVAAAEAAAAWLAAAASQLKEAEAAAATAKTAVKESRIHQLQQVAFVKEELGRAASVYATTQHLLARISKYSADQSALSSQLEKLKLYEELRLTEEGKREGDRQRVCLLAMRVARFIRAGIGDSY